MVKRWILIGNVLSKNQPTWSIVHGLSQQTMESIGRVINVNCLCWKNSTRQKISSAQAVQKYSQTHYLYSSLYVSVLGTWLIRENVRDSSHIYEKIETIGRDTGIV